MQILSDILGKEISVPEEEDAETLGIAILCGEAIDRYENVAKGIDQCVRIATKFTPDTLAHSAYMQYFDLYKRFYEINQSHYESLARTQRQHNGASRTREKAAKFEKQTTTQDRHRRRVVLKGIAKQRPRKAKGAGIRNL